jgi:hypothetical protein
MFENRRRIGLRKVDFRKPVPNSGQLLISYLELASQLEAIEISAHYVKVLESQPNIRGFSRS